MKVSLLAETLQKKLSLINHVISSKPQLPILANILIEATSGKVQLSGTDLEIGIQSTIPAEVEEEGSITVPARTFSELVSSIAHEKISLRTTDTLLEVTSAHTKSVFQTMPSEDFPSLYQEKGLSLAHMSMSELKQNFSSVIFAASTDMSRPALSGVLIKQEEQGFLLVATDGYRLSLKHTTLAQESTGKEGISLIVPARIFREVLAAKDEGEKVQIYVSAEQNQIMFVFAESVLIGRLIAAEFPTYEKIIPSDFSAQTAFNRDELLKAVRICSIFAKDTANIIKLSLRKESIIVSSQASSVGENTVEVEAKFSGEENDIAFNARYLLDILSNLEDEDLTFEMTGPLNPGVFKLKNNESFLHLIMPIKVQA